MKRNLKLITGASAVSLVAFSSLAQETPNAKTGGTEVRQGRSSEAPRSVHLGRVDKAIDLLGMEVQNYEGDQLGNVDDLAVDLETGRIVYVILSAGGASRVFRRDGARAAGSVGLRCRQESHPPEGG